MQENWIFRSEFKVFVLHFKKDVFEQLFSKCHFKNICRLFSQEDSLDI